MKTLVALLSCVMVGCAFVADNETRQRVLWLREAGFQTTPRVPTRAVSPPKSHFQEALGSDGSPAFYFTDSLNGTVYVGGGPEMAAYREIAVRDRARRSANLARLMPGTSRVNGPMVW